jgi:hypothetical protein
VTVGKVLLHEAKPIGFGKLRTPRLLQSRVIIGVHVVEADNVVAVAQETSRDMESNKACRACYQNRAISHLFHSVSVQFPIRHMNFFRLYRALHHGRAAIFAENRRLGSDASL